MDVARSLPLRTGLDATVVTRCVAGAEPPGRTGGVMLPRPAVASMRSSRASTCGRRPAAFGRGGRAWFLRNQFIRDLLAAGQPLGRTNPFVPQGAGARGPVPPLVRRGA